MRRLTLLLPLLLFFACSEPKADESHPLKGSWNQVTADGKTGISLEFNPKNDQCGLHGAPREDGTHRHAGGTYEWTEATGAMTVNMKITSETGPEKWTGTLKDGKLSLSAADQKLEFKKGKGAH